MATEYTNREIYRQRMAPTGLVSFEVKHGFSDLWIAATKDLTARANKQLVLLYTNLEKYITRQPVFRTALAPVSVIKDAPPLIKGMGQAGKIAGVGPIAQELAVYLEDWSERVIIENGGDVVFRGIPRVKIGVFAGASPFTGRLTLEFISGNGELAVCTSSSTVGPALSFGQVDAAIVAANSGYLADAMATALGNRVRQVTEINEALDWAMQVPGVTAALVIMGSTIGIRGAVQVV